MLKWSGFLPERIKQFERPLLILAASAALSAALLNIDFNLFEAKLYDFRMAHGYQAKPDSEIVLITIDNGTTKSLDEVSPLSLDLHTQFIEAMEKLEPKALGYLVDFNMVNQVNPDLFQQEWGSRFVAAATRLQARGGTVLLGTPYDVTGEVLPPYPLSVLPHSISIIHKDGNVFAEDKVTRRALGELNDKPVFHVDLARRMGLTGPDEYPRGAFYVPEVDGKYFFFKYHGDSALQGSSDTLPYTKIPFIDVLRGQLPPGYLKGKIVLVGTMTKEDWADFVFTPYNKTPFANPKLAIHANILDSVIHNGGVVMAPRWIGWLTTFAVTTFVLSWVMNSSPVGGVFSTIGLAFTFALFAQLLFQFRGFWLRESEPLVGIFLGYYLTVPYRLIREYEKRWDYQRKNELLTQVEELKTNFLNLVTHDLKTPVARIQGLAEMLLRKQPGALSSEGPETLRHIIGSTDELNRFITSILELSKVESNHLHLKFESKDINQVVERSIEGLSPQAHAKNISFEVALDPLFPIRIDASLIAKVLTNLIDNAIKYSPAGSTVRVESREVGAWIEISVRDQGIGMTADERENLFTRFYRAKNNTTAETAGTGLGLYLTKYFIEAHSGRVEVESVQNEGSIFKIYLPLENPEHEAAPGLVTKAQTRAEPVGVSK